MPSPFQVFRGLLRPPALRSAVLCFFLLVCLSAAQAQHHTPPTPTPTHRNDQASSAASTFSATASETAKATPEGSTAPSWSQANDSVGRFLRGHIDILRWEKDNASKLPVPAAPPLTTDKLSLDQALQLALRDRPQWLQRPNMSSAEQSRLRLDLQTHVLRVQRAWIEAVSAQQSVGHTRQTLEAAEAGADLAERMAQLGNWSRARQMQEEVLLWEARAQLQSSELQALQTHLVLWQLLADPVKTAAPTTPSDNGNAVKPSALALPTLPTLPDTTRSGLAALESRALAANAQWLSAQAEALRLLQGLTPLSLAQAQQTMAAALQATPAPSLQSETAMTPPRLPAQTPWSHSTENALQAQAQAEAMARQIRADVRLAHAAYLHAHTQATQNQAQVLRLHTALEQESLLRYNGMLKSTWDLLASARQRIQSTAALHQAQTQAWLAWTALQAVLNGLPYTGQLQLNVGNATSSKPSPGH